jgi:anti-anti-sigma regulatory factor
MKLQLAAKNGVTILSVTGSLDTKSFTILKAGIAKLFRDGKNKIILNLSSSEKLDNDVIRDLAILDINAKELSGSIALSGVGPELKQGIANFSKPPVIAIFANDEQALEYFQKLSLDAEEPEEDAGLLKKQLAAKEKEVEALKAQVKLLDPAQLQAARAKETELAAKNKELENQMRTLLLERRLPPDVEAVEAKISVLEGTIKDLTKKMQVQAPAK